MALPYILVSLHELPPGDQEKLRKMIFIANKKLNSNWAVVTNPEGADCSIIPPNRSHPDVANIQLTIGERVVVFEMAWPATLESLEAGLSKVWNHISTNNLADRLTKIGRKKTAWVNNLLGGVGIGDRGRNDKPHRADGAALSDLKVGEKQGKLQAFLHGFNKNKPQKTSVLFVGSPGSGKTTAIQSVADGKVCTTEVNASDSVSSFKQKTTVALDFGECEINGRRVRMFGTPGQLRFAYMIKQTLLTCNSIIFLIDASSPDPFHDFVHYFDLIKSDRDRIKIIIGYTHLDHARVPPDLRDKMAEHAGARFTSVPIDPRDPASVRRALSLIT